MSIPASKESHVNEKDETIPNPASTSTHGEKLCRDLRGSTTSSHHHKTPSHEEQDSSTPEYTSSSSEQQIEVSRAGNEGDIESRVPRVPTDYEVFLAKSQAEYEKQRRQRVAFEMENESIGNKEPGTQRRNLRKGLAIIRIIARVVQVLISALDLAMVITTVRKVREMIKDANDQKVWPDPLLLWPETFIAAVSGISLSLMVLFGIPLMKRLFESNTDVGLYINFCVNLVILLIWGIAVLLFKINSSSKFVWGYACSHSNIASVNYTYFCHRGTLVWAITIVAVAIELPIFIAFLFSIRHNQVEHAEREKSIAELRKMVHEMMTGSREKDQIRHKRSGGWELGAGGVRSMAP